MIKEILDTMEERRLAKGNQKKYNKLNSEIRNMCTICKEKYLEACCAEIEDLEKKDTQIMHEKARHVTYKRKKTMTSCIKDDDGSILMDEEAEGMD